MGVPTAREMHPINDILRIPSRLVGVHADRETFACMHAELMHDPKPTLPSHTPFSASQLGCITIHGSLSPGFLTLFPRVLTRESASYSPIFCKGNTAGCLIYLIAST